MINLLQTAIAFVVALGLLVTIHEFGHFWVARRLGVKILRFSIGFGKPIWSRRVGRDRTEFAVAAIPLGGYVKMLDEREGPVEPSERARAFNTQPLTSRTAIVLAGPLANFLLALVVYWLMYSIGVSGPRPFIGAVAPDGIAHASGLRSGDEIIAVDGVPTAIWDNVFNKAIGAILDDHAVRLTVRAPDGSERAVTLDFAAISVDDISRGEFFDKVGFLPQRPEVPPVIGKVIAGEPAALADLRAGDRIVRLDDESIDDWLTWVERIRHNAGRPLAIVVVRAGQEIALTLTPRATSEDGRLIGRIGAEVAPFAAADETPMGIERYGLGEAAVQAFARTVDVTVTTLKFLRKMIIGEASVQNLSGPISIAQYAGESAKLGISRFLEFLGLVSVSLAVLNLLPIPLLDGGHLLYYLIESVLRRPVPEAIQIYGQQVGLMVLLGLMGLAVYNDIMRIL